MSHFKYNHHVKSHLLTKQKDSLLLGKGNDVGQRINRDVINILQAVAWEINEDILPFIHDTLKPSDEPLTAFEEADRVNMFKVREMETGHVIDYLLENGNKFFFGWKYDKRGRSYSQGYHINPQGNEYRKAMLQFHDKEELTSEGQTHLLMNIADCLGFDKEVWFKRRVEANKVVADIFKDMRSYERKVREYAETADSPLLFRKAINAWRRGVILGEPIGHNMGYDGTASGLQIMSAMSGCSTTAMNCNVHAKKVRKMKPEAQSALAKLNAELEALKEIA